MKDFFTHPRNSVMFLVTSVACALILYTAERFDFTMVVKEVPLEQLRSQKPVVISKKAYYAGEYKIQMYGWTIPNPAPMDGADQYIKINKVNATLDDMLLNIKEDKYEEKDVHENVWTIDVPSSGQLNVTIEDYEKPYDSLLDGTVFLECQKPWTRITSLSLLAVSILSGLIGVIILCILGSIKIIRKLKP